MIPGGRENGEAVLRGRPPFQTEEGQVASRWVKLNVKLEIDGRTFYPGTLIDTKRYPAVADVMAKMQQLAPMDKMLRGPGRHK